MTMFTFGGDSPLKQVRRECSEEAKADRIRLRAAERELVALERRYGNHVKVCAVAKTEWRAGTMV